MDATLFRFRELLEFVLVFVFVELNGDVKEGISGTAGRAGRAGRVGRAVTTDWGTMDDKLLPGTSTIMAIESPMIVAPTITKGAYSLRSSEV